MAITKTLTFDEHEWYELTILLERGIQEMQITYDADDQGAQKWIFRYRRMIKAINN